MSVFLSSKKNAEVILYNECNPLNKNTEGMILLNFLSKAQLITSFQLNACTDLHRDSSLPCPTYKEYYVFYLFYPFHLFYPSISYHPFIL